MPLPRRAGRFYFLFLAFFFFLRFVCGGRFIFMRRERIFNFTSNLQAPFLSNGTISPSIQTSSLTLARNTFITFWKYGPIPLLPRLFLFSPVRLHGAYRRHRLRLARRRSLDASTRLERDCCACVIWLAFCRASAASVSCHEPAGETEKTEKRYHGSAEKCMLSHYLTSSSSSSTSGQARATKIVIASSSVFVMPRHLPDTTPAR